LAENSKFFPPLSFSALTGMTPFEFMKSFTDPETRVLQAADGEVWGILACTVFDWSTCVTDRQTDRIATAKTHYSSSAVPAVARKNVLCNAMQYIKMGLTYFFSFLGDRRATNW